MCARLSFSVASYESSDDLFSGLRDMLNTSLRMLMSQHSCRLLSAGLMLPLKSQIVSVVPASSREEVKEVGIYRY